ncbi:hypothetical protein KJ966_16875 [bacterium]|nr:hypothetical protein [bacterium]
MKKQKRSPSCSIWKLTSAVIPVFALLLFVFGSCSPKYVDPMTLEITDIDLEEAEYPPTQNELMIRPYVMLSLVVFKDETVTKVRLNNIQDFVHRSFRNHGNFAPIPRDEVNILLASEENKRFQPSNVADAIQLGQTLNASFVAQYRVMITESQIIKNIDHYKASINLTIITTDSGQVRFQKDLVYDSQDPEQSEQDLKKLIQQDFPLQGYILETRGGRQYAKISIGRSLGIRLDRKFQVRERIVNNEIVLGSARRTVSFSPLALATVTTVKVMEDAAWVRIEKNDQAKVKKGQMVLALPETTGLF